MMDAEAARRVLVASPRSVCLLFLLDGLPGGIAPGAAGIDPARADALAATGMIDHRDWRRPSGGRVVRRWTRMHANAATKELVEALERSFRNANLMIPPRGVDGLYLLPRRQVAEEAKTRKSVWTSAIGRALADVVVATHYDAASEGPEEPVPAPR